MPLSRRIICACATTVGLIGGNPAQAQPIVPATNTPTSIQAVGNQWQIGQGNQAGTNLFHDFQQFNLPQGQVANFLTNPTIANIFSRVSGGSPSFVDGLLRVTGSQANLFLINPRGIVFGQNARLDLPAAFTAITADGVEFGQKGWLKSIGSNDYQSLIGNPTGYAFTTTAQPGSQPGLILNAGNLSVGPQQSLTLVGGSVVNTGVINAPGGSVTIAAIPGEQLVRINQAGHLLSLELPLATQAALNQPIAKPIPAQLPELLTGGAEIGATGLETINGVTKLTRSNAIGSTAIVSGQITGLTVDISGERISLVGANIAAGEMHIGGDFQGQGDRPRAQQVQVDGSTQLQTNGGKIIVWSDGSTQFAGSATAKGGLVETSGKQTLDVVGARVQARDWLLDPSDITIANAGTITPGTIAAALDGGTNVTITTASGAGGNGDITLTDSINQTGGGTASLTLTGRRFDRAPAAKINLTSTGDLTFNLNQVNPEALASTDSIQNAVNAIGTVPGIRQINLAAGVYSATTPIVIDKPIRINGGDRDATFITGNSSTQVIRVLDQGAELILENTTIRNGNSVDHGGAIGSSGKLTVRNSAFFNNQAAIDGGAIWGDAGDTTIENSFFGNNSARFGGAIENSAGAGGLLTIRDSTFTNNNATVLGGAVFNDSFGRMLVTGSSLLRNSAEQGGAIASAGNTDLTVTLSTINDNIATRYGGGIEAIASRLTLDNVTVENNRSAASGGGIEVSSMLQTLIQNSRILNNQTAGTGNGGGLGSYQSPVTIRDTTVSGNRSANTGGGLEGYESDFVLERVNLSGNTALFGGGISNRSSSGLNKGTIAITDSTISNNQATQNGGGIFADAIASVTIDQGKILDNRAGFQGGGAMFTGTTADIRNTSLENNQVGGDGGAIQATMGTLQVLDSQFLNNQAAFWGGAIVNRLGRTTITGSTFINNRAGAGGGALHGNEGGLAIDNSKFEQNQTPRYGGALDIANIPNATITRTTIQSNRADEIGGGIALRGFGSLNLQQVTLAQNTAGIDGGGLSIRGTGNITANLTNTTIVGNQAVNSGGGLNNNGQLNLMNVTIANNLADQTGMTGGLGGGIFNQSTGTIQLNNTIVANNRANNRNAIAADVAGTFIDQGNNLIGIGDGATGFTTSTLVGTNVAPIDPLLGVLANNGGLTSTIALLPGSRAIDAGSSNQSTDQRGLSRLRAADIGAFESQALIIPPVVVPPIVTPPIVTPPIGITPPIVVVPVPGVVVNPVLPTIPVTSATVAAPQLSAASDDLEAIVALDNDFSGDYAAQFGAALGPKMKASGASLSQTLRQLKQPDRGLPAVIYALFVPAVISQTVAVTGVSSVPNFLRSREAKPNDRLELVLVRSDGKFMRRSTSFTRSQVAAQMSYFWLINDDVENKTSYTAFGNQFYQWLMQPIESDLKQAKVQTLIYVLDQGLRQIPVATMQRSANNWVGNDYQMSVVASLGLLKPHIKQLRNQTIVAMGADTFKTLQPLPAVGTELNLIGRENPIGTKFLNQDFTLANLQQQITDRRPGILHLATHAQFNSGIPSKSYIQLWDRPLGIDQLKQLGLEQAGIELLVLSACNTASGSKEAELGFTGIASLSGVNTVLGSIWSVSDLGTLAFMTEFYDQLKTTPSRVEALRQTQQAMRSGQVRVDRDYLVTTQGRFPLPSKIQRQGTIDFVHPFYWAGFTMVGNPW